VLESRDTDFGLGEFRFQNNSSCLDSNFFELFLSTSFLDNHVHIPHDSSHTFASFSYSHSFVLYARHYDLLTRQGTLNVSLGFGIGVEVIELGSLTYLA
jgi:hypothetical protein